MGRTMNKVSSTHAVCKTCLRAASLIVIGCALYYLVIYMNTSDLNLKVLVRMVKRDETMNSATGSHQREEIIVPRDFKDTVNSNFLILWYSYPPFIKRQISWYASFDRCQYKNCRISFDRNDAIISKAVLFDGRKMPKNLGFERPMGQIWIFHAHESPLLYTSLNARWTNLYRKYIFNWTMTYDKDISDIHLPYGEIQKRTNKVKMDYRAVAAQKNKTAIMMSSHCTTLGKREEYVTELQKYIDVEVLGLCGKEWNCQRAYHHSVCFTILDKDYKFYLAFENAFCHQYFTEKFYDNFNYDTIMVTRGGSVGEAKSLFPAGTFISTDDFNSIKELGQYLKSMSTEKYAKLLERKNQYYSIGYREVYQKALCNVCERLNNEDKYRKVIKDIRKWAFKPHSCLRNVTVV